MKLMIASDLHGSYFYASQMQQAFEREQADRLLLLGDLLYHGPRNDLPEGYAPKQVMPLLNGMKDRLLCVRGNCDAEVDQMVLDFPMMADYALLELDGQTAGVRHPRPCLQHQDPAAAGPRRHSAARAHPHPGVGALRAGQPLPEPRLGEPAEGGQRPQLHDVGKRLLPVENHGRPDLPRTDPERNLNNTAPACADRKNKPALLLWQHSATGERGRCFCRWKEAHSSTFSCARYCRASSRESSSSRVLPARSATVRATRKMRSCARAESPSAS